MKSLRARLFIVWALSLIASLAVGLLLVQLYHQSSAAQLDRARAELQQACERISDRYAYYVSGWSGELPETGDAGLQNDLDSVVALALTGTHGLGGGILRMPAEITPATTQSTVAAAALAGDGTSSDDSNYGSIRVLTFACRMSGPLPDMAAWVGTEISAAPGTSELQFGLGVLMALMLSLSVGLTWLVTSWTQQVRRMEAALARHDAAGLPRIAPTGETELDRIAHALNIAGARLQIAQDEASAASLRAARAERMAALGRVAAGVAHEIRNPIAAMRLRAEGALAVDPAIEPDRATTRGRSALGAILAQVDRLDRLSGELLTMTQRVAPTPLDVELSAFLRECIADWPGVKLADVQGHGRFDPGMIRRALDNLIQNARRHASMDGTVLVRAECAGDVLRIEVEDTGPGVPEALRDTLFEPFVTGRADGTGLGLAIAREMVQAHGGRLLLVRAEAGAVFAIELPQESDA